MGEIPLRSYGAFEYTKVPYDLKWKATKPSFRKNHMRQLYHTTELIGIKDKNITLTKVFSTRDTYWGQATLDYTPPKCCHCQGKQIKYDFQKPSKIPFIEIGGLSGLIRLKKRRFQCKDCHKVTVSETSLVQKNCQISEFVKQKITQLLLKREALTHIAEKLAILGWILLSKRKTSFYCSRL